MKINKLYIAIAITAGVTLQGCKDSKFLDVPSREIVEAEDSGEVYTGMSNKACKNAPVWCIILCRNI